MNNNTNGFVQGFVIFFTCLIVSCNNKKDALLLNVIPLASSVGKYKTLNLSDYATEIRYIPLETNDSVLVGARPRICYENGHIFISEALHNCYLFDNDGKFCHKIGQRGQGPNEYFALVQSFMQDGFIFLNDNQKILIYDMNGYPIETINLWSNDIPAKYRGAGDIHLSPLKKNTFVMNVISMEGDYPKAILFETHQSGVKMIKEYPNFVTLHKLRSGIVGGERGFIYRFENDVRTYKGINDTVFTIGQNTEMKTAFIFDLGKYKRPLSFYEWREDINATFNNYIYLYAIYESLNYLFIEFSFGNYTPESSKYTTSRGTQGNANVCGVFDKRKGEFTLLSPPIKGKLGFKNDIDNGPVIWPEYITTNDELVSLIHPEDFMEYYEGITNPSAELKKIADRIKPDDNPIVVVTKLK